MKKTPSPDGDPRDIDDERLMERLGEGCSEEAFTVIVERYQAALYHFFRRLGADAGEAEDEVQETFLRVYVHRRSFRPVVSFRAWLYAVARNVRYDRLRKTRRSRERVGLDEPTADQAVNLSASGDVERIDGRLDVREALDRLPQAMRTVLILSVYQGLTYSEIAEVLGIPLGTVKTRAFYGLRKLKEHIESGVRPAK